MESFTPNNTGSFTLTCVNLASLPQVRMSLVSQQFTVYEMDASDVFDKTSFLESLGMALTTPGVPTASEWQSWDGAADYSWQCLMAQPLYRAAIVVEHCHLLIEPDLSLFLHALEFLIGIALVVEREPSTRGRHQVLLRVILAGKGEGVSAWPQAPVKDKDGT